MEFQKFIKKEPKEEKEEEEEETDEEEEEEEGEGAAEEEWKLQQAEEGKPEPMEKLGMTFSIHCALVVCSVWSVTLALCSLYMLVYVCKLTD